MLTSSEVHDSLFVLWFLYKQAMLMEKSTKRNWRVFMIGRFIYSTMTQIIVVTKKRHGVFQTLAMQTRYRLCHSGVCKMSESGVIYGFFSRILKFYSCIYKIIYVTIICTYFEEIINICIDKRKPWLNRLD